ncbi:transmembrane protein 45B-like [Dermacentor andersoni]|uniref:transmembrane protein 45B-like n=1 Tax=Dermacentor andersoni TaxID=34620 RepID=UPI002154FE4C|nr:transmembrane protein 45B-like [Dermacentor andersoni]
MGTFYGHVLPGAILFAFGTWWSLWTWRRHARCRATGERFVASASGGRAEGVAKIFAATVGVATEIHKCISKGEWAPRNWHHMATYVFCGLSGPVDLLSSSSRGPGLLPADSDYAVLLLSFVGEGLVFHVHSHGRAPLDVLVHELLVYAIVAQAACLGVEMARRSSVVAALARGFCAILQGTWLIQIAFVLFDPREQKRWNPRSQRDAMLAAAIFAVHVVAALVYVCLLGTIFARRGKVTYSRLPQEAEKEKEDTFTAASVRPGILRALIP